MQPRRPPLERTIVAKVLAMSRALGWWAAKMHGNQYMISGLPDVLVIKHGKVAWMEVKRPGEEPTRVQEHRMRELARAGCPVTVVRSAADARHFLESLP